MGKRYYCDYCDRSFKDDYEARKKHLSSAQHVSNRLEHYRQFRDIEEILKEETSKMPCKKLMTTGDCAFGSSCKFSHFTPPMIWELQQMCAWRSYAKTTKFTREVSNADEIIHEYFENSMITNDTEIMNTPVWSRPLELQNITNLPPSLWPITPCTITDSNFTNWGR